MQNVVLFNCCSFPLQKTQNPLPNLSIIAHKNTLCQYPADNAKMLPLVPKMRQNSNLRLKELGSNLFIYWHISVASNND